MVEVVEIEKVNPDQLLVLRGDVRLTLAQLDDLLQAVAPADPRRDALLSLQNRCQELDWALTEVLE